MFVFLVFVHYTRNSSKIGELQRKLLKNFLVYTLKFNFKNKRSFWKYNISFLIERLVPLILICKLQIKYHFVGKCASSWNGKTRKKFSFWFHNKSLYNAITLSIEIERERLKSTINQPFAQPCESKTIPNLWT